MNDGIKIALLLCACVVAAIVYVKFEKTTLNEAPRKELRDPICLAAREGTLHGHVLGRHRQRWPRHLLGA